MNPIAPGVPGNTIEAGAAAFPNARTFQAYLHPETGHAMNYHINATGYHEVVQQFLGDQGLASGRATRLNG